MATLKPSEAARTAQIAYAAKTSGPSLQRLGKASPELKDHFDFDGLNRFSSKTGAFFKVRSGFGFVVKGTSSSYKGETLVGIRGTASLADGLTDLNTGIHVCSTGKIVHAGFNRTFREIEGYLDTFIEAGSRVHFCGHSLGGALATMAADWAVQKKSCDVKIYTFGCPRVGFKPFADRITQSVSSGSIYRVHRASDIVPMVPIWPFVHAPQPGLTCKIPTQGKYSPLAAHSIDHYLESVKSYGWDALLTPEDVSEVQAKAADLFSLEGMVNLSSSALSLIGKAIAYILKAAGIVIQCGAIAGVSILDMLSLALEKAVKVSQEVAGWVTYLLEKIARICGFALRKTGSITVEFIRWVFSMLTSSVRRILGLAILDNA